MEGEADDKGIAYMIERDECYACHFKKWYGMKPTTPIISGGMNALRLPGFFQNLGHGNVMTPQAVVLRSHRQPAPLVRFRYVNRMSALLKRVLTRLNSPNRIKNLRAFESFPNDADKLFCWREKLGVHK